MVEKYDKVQKEMDELTEEIESFKREKERVRAIIGQIGGVPRFNTTIFNIIFIFFILITLAASLVSGGVFRLAMIELALAAISAKLMFLINDQSRVNHFQLWILSSIEWQINEISKIIKELKNNP